MVRFAAECRAKMNALTQELESKLGPGTDDLKLRIGLHSGAVTAGVLRYVLIHLKIETATKQCLNRPLAAAKPDSNCLETQ